MATALDWYIMAISPLNPLLPSEGSHNDSSTHGHSTHRSHETEPHEVTGQHEATGQHEVAGHATNKAAGTTPQTETKFLPLHVFNHHVMNPMGNSVARRTSLQERRERSKLARPEKAGRGSETSVNDAIVAVAGRARAAGVSLTRNLLRDPSSDEQHGGLETKDKGRKQNPELLPHLYMKAAKNGTQKDLSPEEASHMLALQDGDEPGRTTLTLAELEKVINEQFPTWPELRQAIIKRMRKLENQLDPKERERLMRVTLRELRNGSVKMHTTIDGVVFELTALGLTNFFIEFVGPENCEGAMTVGRRMSVPVSAY